MSVFEIETNDHHHYKEIEIVDYLNKHPEFLVENADRIHLLNDFKYNIFNLARKYREENHTLQKMMENFLQVAENNFQLLLTLSEMNRIIQHSTRIDHVIPYVIDFFKDKFGIEMISLYWSEAGLPPDIRQKIMKSLHSTRVKRFMFVNADLFRTHGASLYKPVVKQRKCQFLTYFFPAALIESIQSAVVIPLKFHHQIMGTLSLGSRESHRFHPGLSYEFIMGTAEKIASGMNLLFMRQLLSDYPEKIPPSQFMMILALIQNNKLPGESLQIFTIRTQSGFAPPDIQSVRPHFHSDDVFYALESNLLLYIPNHYCQDPQNIRNKLYPYLKDPNPEIIIQNYPEFCKAHTQKLD